MRKNSNLQIRIKKPSFVLLFLILCTIACNNNIDKATILFNQNNNSVDSIVITATSELKKIDKYLSNKVSFTDKLCEKYYLKIKYANGTLEEYSGNGYFLRDRGVYYNPDTSIQNDFLKVINSKLPLDLR